MTQDRPAARRALTAVEAGRIRTQLELDILRAYGRGAGLKDISLRLGCGDAPVSSLITEIRFSRGLAQQLVREAAIASRRAVPPPAPAPSPQRARPAAPTTVRAVPAPATTMEAPMPAALEHTTAVVIDTLIQRAHQSGSAKAARLAGQLRTLVDDLTTALDRVEHEQALRKKIADLQAQIDETRKELGDKPTPARSAPTGPTPATIRAWAASAGVPCSALGRVPATVVEAYHLAHPTAA